MAITFLINHLFSNAPVPPSSCNKSSQDAEGCKAVSTTPFQLDLCTSFDPARDLQRIHSLVMRHMKDIEELIATPIVNHLHSHHVAIGSGGGGGLGGLAGQEYVSMAKSCVLDEQCRTTLERVREIALNLDQVHMGHRNKLAKDTKLGSRQAPIGEDNYLHMTRSNLIMQNGGAVVPYMTVKESIVYPRCLATTTMYSNGNEYSTLGSNGKMGGQNVTIITTNSSTNSPNASLTMMNGNSPPSAAALASPQGSVITTSSSGGGIVVSVGELGAPTVTLLRQSPNVFSPLL